MSGITDTRVAQWTLTLLSVWWAFGQLVASLISWVFIANYSCNPSIPFGVPQIPKHGLEIYPVGSKLSQSRSSVHGIVESRCQY